MQRKLQAVETLKIYSHTQKDIIPTNANPYFENHWLTPFLFLSLHLSQLSFLAKALNCLASYLLPNIFLFTHVSISALEIRVLQFWGFFSLYLKLGKWKCFECKWKQYCKNSSCALQNKNEWTINICICIWRTFTFARHDEARKMFHYQLKLIQYPDNFWQTNR